MNVNLSLYIEPYRLLQFHQNLFEVSILLVSKTTNKEKTMVFSNTMSLFLRSLICCFALLICLSLGFPTEESILSSNKAKQDYGIFEKWMKKYGKTYSNSKEGEIRFQTFQENLKYIREKNFKRSNSSSGHRLGLSKFADMSKEEFKKVYLHQQKMPNATKTAFSSAMSVSDCAAPASMDWRSQGVVTPVKDQGSCGKHTSLYKLCI